MGDCSYFTAQKHPNFGNWSNKFIKIGLLWSCMRQVFFAEQFLAYQCRPVHNIIIICEEESGELGWGKGVFHLGRFKGLQTGGSTPLVTSFQLQSYQTKNPSFTGKWFNTSWFQSPLIHPHDKYENMPKTSIPFLQPPPPPTCELIPKIYPNWWQLGKLTTSFLTYDNGVMHWSALVWEALVCKKYLPSCMSWRWGGETNLPWFGSLKFWQHLKMSPSANLC